jgi:transcriptional regulator with XRE-family HTH domain
MKDRIILLIKAKNLTAAQFADEVGVQKSSISHIISGRNNASLDFIQKILIRYPEVNMEWIMLGKGPIFKGAESAQNVSNDEALKRESTSVSASVDLFSVLNPDNGQEFRNHSTLILDENEDENVKAVDTQISPDISESEKKEALPVEKVQRQESILVRSGHKNSQTKTILKIVEFYSDNTYREYFPE